MDDNRRFDVRVRSVTWLSPRVNAYELVPENGVALLPEFSAGAHVAVSLPGGIVRSYSILNPQSERNRYVLGVANDVSSKGGSRAFHERVRPGDIVRISEPRNHFPLREDARHSVLIGGGIGVTPLLSMVARLESLGRDWTLHYAVQSIEHAAFASLLVTYASKVNLHLDNVASGVLDLANIIRSASSDTEFYCCGPRPMLAAFEAACVGVAPERVHIECFTADESPATNAGCAVRLARSERVIHVKAGQSILEAVRAAGVDVASSCEQGVCGICEVGVLEGVPDHRDAVLSPAERTANRSMMICCSGALTPTLTLDL
jgi:vanillate O-demethylase ferredoxin subunit